MKKFRINFEMDREYGNLIIKANSEDEAKEEFDALSPGDVINMACIIPEFEVDYVEEVEEEED